MSTPPVRLGLGELFVEDCVTGMTRLPAASVDAVVTDPPFGIKIGGAPWDSFEHLDAFQDWTVIWAVEAVRVLRPDGVVAVFAQPRFAHRVACALEAAGAAILDQVMWLYGNGSGINVKHGHLRRGVTPIILASKDRHARLRVEDRRIEAPEQPARWPTNVILDEDAAADLDQAVGMRSSGSRRAGVRKSIGYMKGSKGDDSPAIVASKGPPSRYFCYAPQERGRKDRPDHVTVKPLRVMKWLIGLVAAPEQVVLDPFMGSGTTAVACEELGNRWIGFENDLKTADEARVRIARAIESVQPILGLDLDG